MIPSTAPIIIGGTGGSGTRVFMRVVSSAGVDMGKILNVSEDAISLTEFCDRWINIAHTGKDADLLNSKFAEMEAEFLACLEQHCAHMQPGAVWGWKYPRTIYLLPFVYRYFPQMRFIHVIRNGLDMAFSDNQNQLRKHGAAVLNREVDFTSPQDSLALWSTINSAAADFGHQILKDNYIRIQFEELVKEPIPTMQKIWSFMNVSKPSNCSFVEVRPPHSIGRWQKADPSIISDLLVQGKVPLQRFGYSLSTATK